MAGKNLRERVFTALEGRLDPCHAHVGVARADTLPPRGLRDRMATHCSLVANACHTASAPASIDTA